METGDKSVVCIDVGTTNARGWLVSGDVVLARAQTQVGVRDSAREGSATRLRSALKDLIARVCAGAPPPSYVAAAGMITSSLGLAEVAHIEAPAGLEDLARSVERHSFSDVTEFPLYLVPGVRTGPMRTVLDTISNTDVMRGEETLCVGLMGSGLLKGPTTLLNLGSHWKAIRIDERQRIQSSVTTLSGELIHTAQTQTILASAVPRERLAAVDDCWVDAGMQEGRRSGISRALFCVRLLEQKCDGSPEQRLSFLAGVFIGADLDAFMARRALGGDGLVVITGGGALAQAWLRALSRSSIRAAVLSESEVEHGLLEGLKSIVEKSSEYGR
ncbi:MAG TPA: 2-dehydro-3-deoxygalactonokinase [Blastocatellia bacterium]|nr:2-dehydro-3-deoxygalactonokinase [Blastocatellia bacterium]